MAVAGNTSWASQSHNPVDTAGHFNLNSPAVKRLSPVPPKEGNVLNLQAEEDKET